MGKKIVEIVYMVFELLKLRRAAVTNYPLVKELRFDPLRSSDATGPQVVWCSGSRLNHRDGWFGAEVDISIEALLE